ncbi:dihydroxyacetone kinase subunit DhaL [Methylococcus sp. EFPC2]|uniref:dihydroxyacetone kinase subunit DhaL n=1 Tax=Methylococcus sp. EFPC2 TaxID=2812648 RepID=UPI0019671D2F|nr:dihydroxyacetone kinase subunit DhaL [Methylococcus sp. EFPC2]QSA98522.1 dihydroxyacetone kinase subunit L [Methylococcus sp. EFPC2]
MTTTPACIPEFIAAVGAALDARAEEVTALDSAIGDGDHLINLQRGLAALAQRNADYAEMDWPSAWRAIGMTVMSAVGGASGSLYATLFLAMAKQACPQFDASYLGTAFSQGVEAMKLRGKSDVGEKTLLDVLVPVAQALREHRGPAEITKIAEAAAESTRDMLPGKGRASFLGERARGHVDAGARTAQLMISAIIQVTHTPTA